MTNKRLKALWLLLTRRDFTLCTLHQYKDTHRMNIVDHIDTSDRHVAIKFLQRNSEHIAALYELLTSKEIDNGNDNHN